MTSAIKTSKSRKEIGSNIMLFSDGRAKYTTPAACNVLSVVAAIVVTVLFFCMIMVATPEFKFISLQSLILCTVPVCGVLFFWGTKSTCIFLDLSKRKAKCVTPVTAQCVFINEEFLDVRASSDYIKAQLLGAAKHYKENKRLPRCFTKKEQRRVAYYQYSYNGKSYYCGNESYPIKSKKPQLNDTKEVFINKSHPAKYWENSTVFEKLLEKSTIEGPGVLLFGFAMMVALPFLASFAEVPVEQSQEPNFKASWSDYN